MNEEARPPGTATPRTTGAGLRSLYEAVVLERAAQMQLGPAGGPGPASPGLRTPPSGHEGAVAAASALRRRDDGSGDLLGQALATPGPLFVMGATPLEYFRERLARAGAPSRGRTGHGAWSDFRRGFVAAPGLPGTAIEVVAGITLGFRMRAQDRVGMVVDHDPATGSGAWHEGLNLAATLRCPLVVVLVGTSRDRERGARPHSCRTTFLEACDAYGIEGRAVDAGDLVAVFGEAETAVARARAGGGVQLLELRDGDGGDPLVRLRSRMVEEGQAGEEELTALEAECGDLVASALDRALSEAQPIPSEALVGIWTDVALRAPWFRTKGGTPMDPHVVRGVPGGPFIDPWGGGDPS